MKKFAIATLVAIITLALALVTGFVSFLNDLWGSGLEAVTGTIAMVVGLPALVWWQLPRYTAVCSHDGRRWLDVPGIWSAARGVAAGDLEQFTKQWLGQTLTGKFITTAQARVPVNPVPRLYSVKLFGPQRGVYFIVGVRVNDSALLEKFQGRVDAAPVKFEEEDEYLPMK